MTARCQICGRPLGVATDPKSLDCGGDCLGCIEWAEGRGPAPPLRDDVASGESRIDSASNAKDPL